MKRPSAKPRGKALRPRPFENNKVDFSKFKTELSASDIAKLVWAAAGPKVLPVLSIEVLSPAKTVGLGRTHLTLGHPYVVTTHATTPYAEFGKWGSVFLWFEPIAYGIASVASYVIAFNIEVLGNATFAIGGRGISPNAGLFECNGSRTVQLILQDASPNVVWAVLEQQSGADWKWYSSAITFPEIIVQPQPPLDAS